MKGDDNEATKTKEVGGGARMPVPPAEGLKRGEGLARKTTQVRSQQGLQVTQVTRTRDIGSISTTQPQCSRLDIDGTNDPSELDDILATRRVGSGERTESTEAASEEVS